MARRIDIPCDELRRLYEEEGLGIVAIAHIYACSPTTISLRLRACAVPSRPSQFKPLELPLDEIRHLYLEERLPVSEIAHRLGVSVNTIHNRRRFLRLPRRSRKKYHQYGRKKGGPIR